MRFRRRTEDLLVALWAIVMTCIAVWVAVGSAAKSARLDRLGHALNCESAYSCYHQFVEHGVLPPGCVEVFELVSPDKCVELLRSMDVESGF